MHAVGVDLDPQRTDHHYASTHAISPTRGQLRDDAEGGDPALLHGIHLEPTVGAVVHERKGIDRVQRHLIEGADAVGDHGQNQILVLENGAVVGVLVEEEDELLTGTETGFAAAEK